jgi:RES domain-containing protein
VTLWRIVKRHRIEDAFTGEGARRYGGRWNRVGPRVVYASASLALAQLEYLVHANALHAPSNVVCISAEVPDDLPIEEIRSTRLPRHWRRFYPPVDELLDIGDHWTNTLKSAVLRIPSALVPSESNYLLNPSHPAFTRIAIGKPKAIRFDARLF